MDHFNLLPVNEESVGEDVPLSIIDQNFTVTTLEKPSSHPPSRLTKITSKSKLNI
jgi:hypothetical protein